MIVCSIALRANIVEANILSHRFLSSSTMFCTFKVRRILPIVWYTLSNIALEVTGQGLLIQTVEYEFLSNLWPDQSKLLFVNKEISLTLRSFWNSFHLPMVWFGICLPIKSTHIVSRGLVSDFLGGNFPHWFLFCFRNCQAIHLEQTSYIVLRKFSGRSVEKYLALYVYLWGGIMRSGITLQLFFLIILGLHFCNICR